MLPLFHWIGHTALGIALRQSTWAFAIIEVVHLLALALFGGSVLLTDLRLFGVGINTESISKVVRSLSPLVFGSLAVMVVTGVLMVVSGPMRYYYNEAFRLKMLLFLAGALVQVTLHAFIVRSSLGASWWYKIASGFSLVLWLCVALAGRAIGYV